MIRSIATNTKYKYNVLSIYYKYSVMWRLAGHYATFFGLSDMFSISIRLGYDGARSARSFLFNLGDKWKYERPAGTGYGLAR